MGKLPTTAGWAARVWARWTRRVTVLALTLGVWAVPLQAFSPPLTGVEMGTEVNGGTGLYRVWFQVYDPELGVMKRDAGGWQLLVSPSPHRQDGVATWWEMTGDSPARWQLGYAVYDPEVKAWARGFTGWQSSASFHYTGAGTASSGAVAWLEKPLGQDEWRVGCATYDPSFAAGSRWRVAVGGLRPEAVVQANVSGVIAWLERETGPTGSLWRVCYCVYDPLRRDWALGSSDWATFVSYQRVENATVYYSVRLANGSDAPVYAGYDSALAWRQNMSTTLTPAFVVTPVSGVPPLPVWLTDMSIGASGWSWAFGDGSPDSYQRSTWHTYRGKGRYTLVQSTASATGHAEARSDILTDLVPPACSVSVNAGAEFAASTSVALTVVATDDTGGTVVMRLSNDGQNWTGWQPYTASVAWVVPEGSGTKTVYAQARDGAGNLSTVASDTIRLDATPPQDGTLTAKTGTGRVLLSWTGFADPDSGIVEYRLYHLRRGTGTSPSLLYHGSGTSYEHMDLTSGIHDYTARAVNGAGAESSGAAVSLVIDGRTLDVISGPPKPVHVQGIASTLDGVVDNAGGDTDYQLLVPLNTRITLQAPTAVDVAGRDYVFQKWRVNQTDVTTAQVSIVLSQSSNAVVFYQVVDRALTVRAKPLAQVEIGGTGGGTTPYTRQFEDETAVAVSAPLIAAGHLFQRWENGAGALVSLQTTVGLTLSADRELVAVYSAALDFFVNDGTAEPDVAAGDDQNPGTSPAAPMRTVAALLTQFPALASGSTIHLAPGTYTENVVLNTSRSGVALLGSGTDSTVLDGGGLGPCLTLDGLTSGRVARLSLRNGSGPRGGGVVCSNATVVLDGLGVVANRAMTAGGGIACSGGSPRIVNCIIAGNTSARGGGISVAGGSPRIVNCTMVGNRTTDTGSAIQVQDQASVVLANCILWNNPVDGGNAIAVDATSVCAPVACLLGGTTARADDPRFVRDGRWDDTNWVDGDYHLQLDSPAIGQGRNDLVPTGIHRDADGRPRIRPAGPGGIVDVGAFEMQLAETPLALVEGWNLICVPFELDTASRDSLLTAFLHGQVWAWRETRYQADTSFSPGLGAWGYCSAATVATLRGLDPPTDSVRLETDGWHLVGPIGADPAVTVALPLAAKPVTALDPSAWTWTGAGYEPATALISGQAYWVRAIVPCQVTVRGSEP